MSERGVFAVDRGLWDHPVFADEAMSEREAFIWLVGEAAYKTRRVRIGTRIVELARGQVAHSLRFMASKWGWSEARVRRFLGRLKNNAIIDAASDAGQTIVTICNYSKYQRVSLPGDAPSDAEPTQERRKEEDNKYKDNISLGALEAPQADQTPEIEGAEPKGAPKVHRLRVVAEHPAFPGFWAEYPKREGNNPRKPAAEQFRRAIDAGVDPPTLVCAARAYRSELRKAGKERTQYVQQAVNWLKQGNWEGYVPDPHAEPLSGSQVPEATARLRLKRYFSESFWGTGWGAKPGEPGCTIPAGLIEEMRRSAGSGPLTASLVVLSSNPPVRAASGNAA